MDFLLAQVSSILTTAPGNLVYHAVLAFSIAAALQAAVALWRVNGFPQERRLALGLALLLLTQVGLFVAAGLSWQGWIDAHQFLPPLDRSVALLSIVVIVWLWAFPEASRLADAATVLLIALIALASTAGLIWWGGQAADLPFNQSWLDQVAHVLALFLLLGGAVILLLRRPNNWGIGLACQLLLAGGHLAAWLLPAPSGDYAGWLRLAQMAAFPLLLALPQRFPLFVESMSPAARSLIPERRRFSSDPKVLHAFLELAVEPSIEKASADLTRTISQMMLADICLLIVSEAEGHLAVSCGYDLIREQPIEGFAMDERLYPVLSSALHRGRSLRLPASSTSPDLLGLSRALNLGRSVGHLLIMPLTWPEQSPALGLILLSPYSNRGWTLEDQAHLQNSAEALAKILLRNQQSSTLTAELNELRQKVQAALAQADAYQQENRELMRQLEEARTLASQQQSRAESLAAMIAAQEEAQQAVAQLQAELEQTRAQIQSAPAPIGQDLTHLETELRTALDEIERLRAQLAEADQTISKLKAAADSGAPSREQAEVIAAIAQELRQPMSSIIGYTDLLLGESVGILGALQRKFLDRIKASTERMGGLIQDLIQVTSLDSGDLSISPETVNLNSVIDEVIAYSVMRLREKNITMRVDLPEQLPYVKADRDALQQILMHLLQNAGSATPVEGEISLAARVEREDGKSGYVLIQVSDTGGGIPPEDMPRVFSRLYRADNPLIQGVGDTGVGLSIVKKLVEAHGGRVWVDSQLGVGSTFSVLLPLTPTTPIKDTSPGMAT